MILRRASLLFDTWDSVGIVHQGHVWEVKEIAPKSSTIVRLTLERVHDDSVHTIFVDLHPDDFVTVEP